MPDIKQNIHFDIIKLFSEIFARLFERKEIFHESFESFREKKKSLRESLELFRERKKSFCEMLKLVIIETKRLKQHKFAIIS